MMALVLWGMWALGSGAMLAWGAAAAIPLAIHLWSRRRHQEVSWAAMEFLLAAMRKHSRRIRIEQLALLAVRMLMLVLLAVALADPMWSWFNSAGLATRAGATHFLFLVDTSFSMAYRERDRTLLQTAQDQMRRIVEQSDEGDGFSLLLLEHSPRAIIADVGFDRREVLRQIDRLQVSHGSTDLTAALSAVEQLARLACERHPRLVRQRIVVFTDLGQNTWSEVAAQANREAMDRLSTRAEWLLHDVGLEQQTNLAVTDLTASHSLPTLGQPLRLMAEIQSFGTGESVATRVEFLVNGRVAHAEVVQIPAGVRQNVAWEWASEIAGDQVVSARIAADNLLLDNERWLVVPVRRSLTALCVEGEPGAAEFVALALNPESRIDAAIQTTIAGESALLEQDLAQFDCVFVCNVGRVTSFEATALHRYVERGGGLVISLGDQVQADNYNRELAAGTSTLLPAQLDGVEAGEQFFDPLEYRHALVAPFRGRERAGLLTVPTWRFFRLQQLSHPNPLPEGEGTTRIALAFTSGHPAVIETRIGRGRSVLVATALSPSSVDRSGDGVTPWTALPAWPSFPPLIHGLMRTATQGRETGRTVEVGSPLQISLAATDRAATVVRPDQLRERLLMDNPTDPRQATFADTSRCGVYQVEIEGATPHHQLYAANLDARESNLHRLDRSSLPTGFRDVKESAGLADFVFPGDSRQQLFRPLLVLVGMLLLIEQLLAVSFARRTV